VATLAETDGRLLALDALSTTTPCPSWIPSIVSRVVLGPRQALLMSGERDAPKDRACPGSFGFDGGTVLVSMPIAFPRASSAWGASARQ
jgi:hypothetical protein